MKLLKQQYIQIICAIILGFIVAISFDQSSLFIPLGDIFIRLLKMMIVPIFCINFRYINYSVKYWT